MLEQSDLFSKYSSSYSSVYKCPPEHSVGINGVRDISYGVLPYHAKVFRGTSG